MVGKARRRRKRRKSLVNKNQYERLVERCRSLPETKLFNSKDYVTNLMITVLDLRLQTLVVERALEFYRVNRSQQIHTSGHLKQLLELGTPDVDIAVHLWGYHYGNRVATLRQLVKFFESNGITTQAALVAWARQADFERDFKGRVPGLAYAAFKWLVIRLGVDTIKPDLHVLNFVEAAVGKRLSDVEAVAILEKAARELEMPAAQLDARIWSSQRGLATSTIPKRNNDLASRNFAENAVHDG